MQNNRDIASVWDMVQAIRRIQEFTTDVNYSEYFREHFDTKCSRASI